MAPDPIQDIFRTLDQLAPHNVLASLLSGGQLDFQLPQIETPSALKPGERRTPSPLVPTKADTISQRSTQFRRNQRPLMPAFQYTLDEYGDVVKEAVLMDRAAEQDPGITTWWSRHPIVSRRWRHRASGTEETRAMRRRTQGLWDARVEEGEENHILREGQEEVRVISGIGPGARTYPTSRARNRPYPFKLGTVMY